MLWRSLWSMCKTLLLTHLGCHALQIKISILSWIIRNVPSTALFLIATVGENTQLARMLKPCWHPSHETYLYGDETYVDMHGQICQTQKCSPLCCLDKLLLFEISLFLMKSGWSFASLVNEQHIGQNQCHPAFRKHWGDWSIFCRCCPLPVFADERQWACAAHAACQLSSTCHNHERHLAHCLLCRKGSPYPNATCPCAELSRGSSGSCNCCIWRKCVCVCVFVKGVDVIDVSLEIVKIVYM